MSDTRKAGLHPVAGAAFLLLVTYVMSYYATIKSNLVFDGRWVEVPFYNTPDFVPTTAAAVLFAPMHGVDRHVLRRDYWNK
jgi:hypothetical protein